MRIAVAGNKGSFSHQACELYCTGQEIKDVEIIYAIDSEGCFSAITTDEADLRADLCIMPVYNTTGGLVHMTLSAMGRYTFSIKDKFDMQIAQCMMKKPGIEDDAIQTIASHQQALAQCKEYIQRHWPKRELLEYQDTAQAAKDLSEGQLLPTTAVIAPKLSAELYGLQLVGQSIQDSQFNTTTFLAITR